jgi:hypothetical protein
VLFTLQIEIFLYSKNDETLRIINKSKPPKKKRGGKYKEQKGKDPHIYENNRPIKEGESQRENHVFESFPRATRSISNKERGDPFEKGEEALKRTSSLEKNSRLLQ